MFGEIQSDTIWSIGLTLKNAGVSSIRQTCNFRSISALPLPTPQLPGLGHSTVKGLSPSIQSLIANEFIYWIKKDKFSQKSRVICFAQENNSFWNTVVSK